MLNSKKKKKKSLTKIASDLWVTNATNKEKQEQKQRPF